METAEAQLGGTFNVICAHGHLKNQSNKNYTIIFR
jgi:hypothetical protein